LRDPPIDLARYVADLRQADVPKTADRIEHLKSVLVSLGR
jgi:hypothetical protein